MNIYIASQNNSMRKLTTPTLFKTLLAMLLATGLTGCLVTSEQPKTDATPAQPRVDVLLESTKSWDGTMLPSYPDEQPQISILRIEIPAGARLPMHLHPVINAGVLIEGNLTVFKEDGNSFDINEGDAVIEVVDQWHYGHNQKDDPAVIIVFYAGTENLPLSITKPSDETTGNSRQLQPSN